MGVEAEKDLKPTVGLLVLDAYAVLEIVRFGYKNRLIDVGVIRAPPQLIAASGGGVVELFGLELIEHEVNDHLTPLRRAVLHSPYVHVSLRHAIGHRLPPTGSLRSGWALRDRP